MALKVRTSSGKDFRRCGLLFGKEWTVVDDEELNEEFSSPPKPEGSKKSRPTIGEILQADSQLICLPADDVPAAANASANGGRKGKPGK